MGQRGRPPGTGVLTPRETDVVGLVAKGLTNRETSERLGISEQGVRYHLNQVYQKLDLDSREDLIAWYRRERRLSHRLAAIPLAVAALSRDVAPVALAKAGLVAAVIAAAGVAVALVIATHRPAAQSDACRIDSEMVPPDWTVTCFDSVAELESAFGQPVSGATAVAAVPGYTAIVTSPEGGEVAFVRMDMSRSALAPLPNPYVDVMVGRLSTIIAMAPDGHRLRPSEAFEELNVPLDALVSVTRNVPLDAAWGVGVPDFQAR